MKEFVLKCVIFKVKHPGTGEKWYVPYIDKKPLRLSWPTKTKAEAYGSLVLERYLRLKAMMRSRKNGVA